MRCGQRSASAMASPAVVRNSTISSPHTARASGVLPISLPKAMTCQQLRSHMQFPPGRIVAYGCRAGGEEAQRNGMAGARLSLVVAAVLAIGVPRLALAQAEFYRGKQIRLISGHPVGGDYDLGARFVAKHLSRHIPGEPVVVVQNMPAAASVVAANFIYNQAPRDGTVIGSFSRNLASQARMGQPNIEVDPRRFNWLGGYSLPSRVCVNWQTSAVKTIDDLFTREMITAGGGATSSL